MDTAVAPDSLLVSYTLADENAALKRRVEQLSKTARTLQNQLADARLQCAEEHQKTVSLEAELARVADSAAVDAPTESMVRVAAHQRMLHEPTLIHHRWPSLRAVPPPAVDPAVASAPAGNHSVVELIVRTFGGGRKSDPPKDAASLIRPAFGALMVFIVASRALLELVWRVWL